MTPGGFAQDDTLRLGSGRHLQKGRDEESLLKALWPRYRM